MEEIKRISRDLVAHGAIIDYYQDTMQIPNGHVARWDFIKHKGAAAVVPVDDQGRIIMVRQYRNALERYTLEIPAGGQQKNRPGMRQHGSCRKRPDTILMILNCCFRFIRRWRSAMRRLTFIWQRI